MTADAITPALLVPESCRLVERYRPLARSTAMPKLDKQDQRIADIFGVKDVPDVTTETLVRYRLSQTASDVSVSTHWD